LNVSLS